MIIIIKIDCLGEICPIPLLKLQIVFQKNINDIMLVTDHSCAVENIRDFCKKRAIDIEVEEIINGVWEINIKKHML